MLRVKFENHSCNGFGDGLCDLILLQFFFILISVNTNVPFIPHTKFQPKIPSHFGEMDLNARVDVNLFGVDVNFQMVIVT